MLSNKMELGPGVFKVHIPDIWPEIQARISQIFSGFYDEPVPPGFYPHFNEVALRMTLLKMVPELAGLSDAVQGLMESGCCAIIIDKLHIASYPVQERNRLLYALCLAIAFPTPSDQHQATLLWDIKDRPVPPSRQATYSEHSGEAALHTDSQSYPMPEEHLALYTVRAARCGGGVSLFLGVDALRNTLNATTEGAEVAEILSTQDFPFYISAGEAGRHAEDAVTLSPILGKRPAVRFRQDILEKGFQARPDLDTPVARHAFQFLLDAMARRAPVIKYLLPDDGFVLCDNHRILHGRTAFHDPHRHLFRVRMSEQPVAMHIATFLKSQDLFGQAVVA